MTSVPFSGARLAAVLSQPLARALHSATRLQPDDLSRDDDAIASDLLNAVAPAAPQVEWGKATRSIGEVRGLFQYLSPSTGRHETALHGIRVVVSVPYSGTPALLAARPGRYSMDGFPFPCDVDHRTLRIHVIGRHVDDADVERAVAAIRHRVDATLDAIAQELAEWRSDALPAIALEVTARRSLLDDLAALA